MDTPTALPDSFAAGTTVKYLRSVPDYPASSGWTLRLYLAGAATANILATAVSGDFLVTIAAATTATLVPGLYQWTERVTKAGEVYVVGSGQIVVTPDISVAAPGDMVTSLEAQLEQVSALITTRLANPGADIAAYSIAGRSIERMDLEGLQKLQSQLSYAVNRARNGGGLGRQHRANFTGAENE